MNAEKNQVAGNHYKDMAYQPARFGFDVGLESLGTSIAKYLTRDKGSRLENLEKAYHCIALDQQFDEELKEELRRASFTLDIYEEDDEEYLDKFFDQFPDGKKLKAVMRQYMKANYPQAKGLLRKYINSLFPTFKVGNRIRQKSHASFSTYNHTAIIRKVEGKKVWIQGGGWLYAEDAELV